MKNLRGQLPPLSSLLPFEATARLGSITKASAELGLTQAAISKQIRALEENLGAQLFERRNRAVHLTGDGRALGRQVSDAFESIAALSQDLRQKNGTGEVVLRSQLCEGLYWLMPRLSGFYQSFPNIPVRVSVSTAPLTEAEERYDLALQTTSRDSGTAKLAFTVSDEVFPVCSPSYLAGAAPPLRLDRLPHCRLLHHSVHPQDWISWDSWLAHLNADLRVDHDGISYDSYPMMIQAVLEGHGIALGWRRTVEQYLKAGVVVRPFQESLCLPDGLSIYLPSGRPPRSGTTALLNWLKRELSQREGADDTR
ncbi:MAG: LysR substrate-binding domain-containing protein [Pseudomonadota bacterium]